MTRLNLHEISQAIHDEAVEELTEVARLYNLKVKINETTAVIELPEIEE